MAIGSSRKDRSFAGIAVGPVRPPSVKAQAARTTNAGLMNSEGCRPKIQRLAPLTSAPNMSARMMSANDTANVSNAARRTCRGERNEVAIISAAVGISSQGLAVDEVESREIEPLRDRRTCRQRHHQADHHQRHERPDEPPVGGAHPIRNGAAFHSRNHELYLPVCTRASPAARCSSHLATCDRKASPRASKFVN